MQESEYPKCGGKKGVSNFRLKAHFAVEWLDVYPPGRCSERLGIINFISQGTASQTIISWKNKGRRSLPPRVSLSQGV
jgi:hypothetical protein